MTYKYKLGIIGCGNMAEAILSRVIACFLPPKDIIVSDADLDKANGFIKNLSFKVQNSDTDTGKISLGNDNLEVALNSEYVLLAVKPQSVYDLNIGGAKINCLISIMAGISTDTLNKQFKPSKIVRVMPNTPAACGEGMSALCFTACSEEDKKFVKNIFEAVGKTIEIKENQFDAVTAVSGSGPAYVFYLLESLARAGEKQGLSYEQSLNLAIQTFKGAVALAANNGQLTVNGHELQNMIDKVCSPNGTTIEAMKVLRAKSVNKIIEEAVAAAAKRSKELGK